jgi:hypothetical protein
VVDGAKLLVALPGDVDFVGRVAGVEAGGDLGLLLLGEVFHAVAEEPADLIERVVFVTASAQSVLLDAAADFVDDLGAEPDHVKGVKHGDRHTCWDAVEVEARARTNDPARLQNVKTLGVDEHILRPSRIGVDRAVTIMVDLTRD